MTKHTPGPWRVKRQAHKDGDSFHVVGPSSATDESMGTGWSPLVCIAAGGSEANARLIAAAPELLAALREEVAAYDLDGDGGHEFSEAELTWYRRARAAIAKVEGRE